MPDVPLLILDYSPLPPVCRPSSVVHLRKHFENCITSPQCLLTFILPVIKTICVVRLAYLQINISRSLRPDSAIRRADKALLYFAFAIFNFHRVLQCFLAIYIKMKNRIIPLRLLRSKARWYRFKYLLGSG